MALLLSCLLHAQQAQSQEPLLTIRGLSCPGGQNEPTNAHPLIWNCLCAHEPGKHHEWHLWLDTVAVHYGDIVTATWYDPCRAHPKDWDFLALDLVLTNGSGGYVTNSTTLKMRAGFNFSVSYVYWYTNNSGVLLPTNFDVGQLAVVPGYNQAAVLGIPPGLQGLNIAPPLWLDGTNAITDPRNWPPWGVAPDSYPHWPLFITNADGGHVIVSEAQLPFWNSTPFSITNPVFSVQALPGLYEVESGPDLQSSFSVQAAVASGADGVGQFTSAVDFGSNTFFRLRGRSPFVGLGYNLRVQTLGSSFAPAIYCDNGAPAEFLWRWSDGTTSPDFPLSAKSFGFPDSRFQSLRVFAPEAITAVNLGFDGSDGGDSTPLTNRPPQSVGAVYFPYPLTALKYWAASYNPITNTLDFSGFSSLEAVECFHCTNLQHVAVSHLPSLKRVCFENCDLRELDLTGDTEIADVRAALNAFTNVTIGSGAGPQIWHWCIRDNPQLTQDFSTIMTNFYSLQELWIWDDNQQGTLTFVATNLTDVEIEDNFYEFADFGGQTNLQICWAWNNQLTNLIVNGCVGLQELKAQGNQLPGAVLDGLLEFLDSSAPDIQLVDLTDNAGLPSASGYAHYANLTNRGAVVYVDFPGANIIFDSSAIVAEGCMPTNNAIDPGESVTVNFAFRNTGAVDTTNLLVSLLETNGIAAPSAAQSYGLLVAGGLAVTQSFTFTATGSCGGLIVPTFHLQDGSTDLGLISAPLSLGAAVTIFAENFDGVGAPTLPLGWSTALSGVQSPWITTNANSDTAPNSAAALDAPDPGVSDLVSPPISIPAGQMQLSFQNNYDLEPDIGDMADDGGILEIKIGTNSFMDILDAGGSFVTGGYTHTITDIFGNPLAGRLAWSGNSGGYILTVLNLPSAAANQTIQLRWRCATDNDNSTANFAGWHIDTIAILGRNCCTSGP